MLSDRTDPRILRDMLHEVYTALARPSALDSKDWTRYAAICRQAADYASLRAVEIACTIENLAPTRPAGATGTV